METGKHIKTALTTEQKSEKVEVFPYIYKLAILLKEKTKPNLYQIDKE